MDATQARPAAAPRRSAPGLRSRPRPRPRPAERFDLAPPPWVGKLLGGARPAEHFIASAASRGAGARIGTGRGGSVGVGVRVTDSSAFTLVTARVAGAAAMDAVAFERCAAEAYSFVADALAARPHRHPVRFWNHIPDIRRCDEGSIDRYMVFNAGRFAACSRWFGGPAAFDRLLPTASAVGHAGTDLVVHALAGNDPGVAVENPRQVPSYRYSRRFGPRPPCFARATVLPGAGDEGPLVLVAGTASICGEETMHPGDVRAQTLETFENLSVLVEAARLALSPPVGPAVPAETRTPTSAAAGSKPRPARPALRPLEALQSFRDLRVYYVRPADRSLVRRMVAAALPHLRGVEYVRADLCRPDLLVEIEGTAGVHH